MPAPNAARVVSVTASGHARVYLSDGDMTVVNDYGPDPDDRLAALVSRVWEPTASRSLPDPEPIPVAWRTLSSRHADHWSNIRSDGVGRPLSLDGTITRLGELLGDPRHRGRILVLGGAGSGKTACALRLTVDLLRGRGRGDPVPILLRLSTWNPRTQPLFAWVGERLEVDYGYVPVRAGPGAEPGRAPHAGLLLILDGLDEMPDAQWRRAAIDGLDRTLGGRTPLVVTSRTAEYLEAAGGPGGRPLVATLPIELRPLTPEQVEEYLVRTAPPRESHAWRELLAADRRWHSGGLAAALAAPLWVTLAREIGRARPGAVRDLLGARDVHERLLDLLVPAVYPTPAEEGPDGHTWRAECVQGWLSFLARDRGDIAWWRIAELVPPRTRDRLRNAFLALPVGVALGAICWRWVLGPAAVLLIPFFVAIALTQEDVTLWTTLPAPARRRFRLRRRSGARRVGMLPLAGLGSAIGGFAGGLFFVLFRSGGLHVSALPGTAVAVMAGALFMTGVLALMEFTTAFEPDADPRAPIEPARMVADDRFRALVLAGGVGVAVAAATAPILGGPAAVALGPAVGLAVLMTGTAWGWFQLARCWLAANQLLPWRVLAFLRDAHRRGVLRRSGAILELRHAALRDRLARIPSRPPRAVPWRLIRLGLAGAGVAAFFAGMGLASFPQYARYPTPSDMPDTGQPVVVDVSPGTVRPGGRVQVHGAGFGAGEQVHVHLSAATYTANAGARGEFRITATVPPATACSHGQCLIAAVGAVTARRAEAVLLVS